MHPESAVSHRPAAANVNPYFKQQMDTQATPQHLRSADSFASSSLPSTIYFPSTTPPPVVLPSSLTSSSSSSSVPSPLNPYPPPQQHYRPSQSYPNQQQQQHRTQDPLASVEREIRIGAVRAVRNLIGWIIVCLALSTVSLIAMKGTGMMLPNDFTGFAVWVAGNILQFFCIAAGVVSVLIAQYKRYALETAE
ncbi:hypothetical protein DFJ73DRAFT_883374 [Zopfochytrium polystomum]|nr:hypothetical protein DFJ73DRAFT_883374 [Zopfochytrium polystomum]